MYKHLKREYIGGRNMLVIILEIGVVVIIAAVALSDKWSRNKKK